MFIEMLKLLSEAGNETRFAVISCPQHGLHGYILLKRSNHVSKPLFSQLEAQENLAVGVEKGLVNSEEYKFLSHQIDESELPEIAETVSGMRTIGLIVVVQDLSDIGLSYRPDPEVLKSHLSDSQPSQETILPWDWPSQSRMVH